jgi:hypothetical protein
MGLKSDVIGNILGGHIENLGNNWRNGRNTSTTQNKIKIPLPLAPTTQIKMLGLHAISISKTISYFFCRNPSLGLATKARACKVVGQEGTLGGTLHAPGSAKECEGMNPHTLK